MDNSLEKILTEGKIAVIPTDTIYGIVGSALNEKTVEKIYLLRKRNIKKPFIVLISELKDLEKFDINLTTDLKKILSKLWPNKISVILHLNSKRFEYLHRGHASLAFRLPNDKFLINLIDKVGPLVAPSANTEGKPPSRSIDEAKMYFGDKVDFYHDAGILHSEPSTLVEIEDSKVKVLRVGAVDVTNLVK